MLATIGQMLPLAIAGTLSSVPVIGVLTLLLGGRGRAAAVLFTAGYLVGVFVVSTVATLIFGSAVVPAFQVGAWPVLGVLETALGAAGVVAGVVILRRPMRSERSGVSARLTALLARVRPGVAMLVGTAIALRPKSLLVASGIGIVLGSSDVPVIPDLILLAAATVVTTSSVSVPVVFAIVRAEQARAGLEAVRGWLARNARTVTVVVLVLVGTLLVGNGLGRF